MALVFIAAGALLLCLLRYGLLGFIDPAGDGRGRLVFVMLNWSGPVLLAVAACSGLGAIGVAAVSVLGRDGAHRR